METIHPKQEIQRIEQKSPTIADQKEQSTPVTRQQAANSQDNQCNHEKIKLKEINPYLTCHLCKGYLIDATTISECLHSFCRSCIIKFLEDEDHSYCPVCEVIINKAKPNLKLDKTLQDIVYKLVPGLFLAEMLRRKRFYAERPGEAGGVSPEQRGEDTERTIFNPQDRISLSLEYIGDAATSGLILKDLKNTLLKELSDPKKGTTTTVPIEETLLKRYLQCPGMCRIDVIKKFIRNKYNVNTDLFQIDILYKRVPLPLPDHYTLIDIAYIYTWKRNEPMRFYFRIIEKGNDELPDLTKVFTPIEALPPPLLRPSQVHRSTPTKKPSITTSTPEQQVAKTSSVKKRTPRKRKTPTKQPPTPLPTSPPKLPLPPQPPTVPKIADNDKTDEYDFDKNCDNESDFVKFESVQKKRDANNDNKGAMIVKSDSDDGVKKIYTNITLNRTNNSETITTIEKVQNDKNDGGDKTEAVADETSSDKAKPETVNGLIENELEMKKNEFFKSIELTSKKVVANLAKLMMKQQQQQIKTNAVPPITAPEVKTATNNSAATNGLKRKHSSPTKKPKKTTKIIIQQKRGYVPIIPERNRNELKSLFQNCRLNIPSSLSITLKENGETSRKPLLIPPVQNYIEILKIDEKEGKKTLTLKRDDNVKPSNEIKTETVKPDENAKSLQSFQKIFEDSIKSTENEPNETQQQNKRKNFESPNNNNEKKIKLEGKEVVSPPPRCSTPFPDVKLTIPRVVENVENTHQTVANLHSSSLGLNYTVSVGKPAKESTVQQVKTCNKLATLKCSPGETVKNGEVVKKEKLPPDVGKIIKSSPPKMNYPIKKLSPKSPNTTTSPTSTPQLTPNQLLEKYNIQNLAQLSASINFNAAMSPNYHHQQMAALQQAMIMKHQFEMQNRQKWLSINQGPLLQFEKYLQTLNASKNQILGKDN